MNNTNKLYTMREIVENIAITLNVDQRLIVYGTCHYSTNCYNKSWRTFHIYSYQIVTIDDLIEKVTDNSLYKCYQMIYTFDKEKKHIVFRPLDTDHEGLSSFEIYNSTVEDYNNIGLHQQKLMKNSYFDEQHIYCTYYGRNKFSDGVDKYSVDCKTNWQEFKPFDF
jgi:hypothetical protein